MSVIKLLMFFSCLAYIILLGSCNPEDPVEDLDDEIQGYSENSVFVINEGQFQVSSGTITHYNKVDAKLTQDIFRDKNNRDLGNVVQSMTIIDTFAYVVVNNSNKIEKVLLKDFSEFAQITGLEQPRYCIQVSDQVAYVSQWGLDGVTSSVAVIDINSNQIIKTIPTAKGAEQLLKASNGKVYVACVGGYDVENKVQVINTQNHEVEQTFELDYGPNSLVEDMDGNIWVACRGHMPYSSSSLQDTMPGSISKIDVQNSIVNTVISFNKGEGARRLLLKDNELLFLHSGGIWSNSLGSTNKNLWIEGNFYGFGIDPSTNIIYTAQYKGIEQAVIERYESTGEKIDSFQAGIFANGFVFN
ncbi:MAG: hypothetical protein MK212_12975 [Saprospiraceae bacterium]|nr:hypothetical protein [Saprospiraceae bacterium]